MTIPKEAVDAAVDAMSGVNAYDLRALAADILEAAAPHMLNTINLPELPAKD